MSARTYHRAISSATLYKMHATIIHLLESMEGKLPLELYQKMYDRLLHISNRRLVQLHTTYMHGDVRQVFNNLSKGSSRYWENAQQQAHARSSRKARLRRRRTSASGKQRPF